MDRSIPFIFSSALWFCSGFAQAIPDGVQSPPAIPITAEWEILLAVNHCRALGGAERRLSARAVA
jgi:hypothetical protein